MKLRHVLCAFMLAVTVPVMTTGCGLAEKGIDKYDTLVDKDEACNQAWADYESNLQRRSDMIPQLVSVVKGAMGHEQATLVAVTQARASATQVKMDVKQGDFEDPEKFKQFAEAQNGLGTAMSRLMVASENYPELRATKLFSDLQTQIEGTENRLLRAREQYNKAVAEFNKELRHVSGKVINPVTGHEFKPRVFFQAAEGAKEAPKVDFGTGPANTAIQPAAK